MDPCGNYCENLALAGLSTISMVRSVRDIHRNVEIEKDFESAQHHYAFERKSLRSPHRQTNPRWRIHALSRSSHYRYFKLILQSFQGSPREIRQRAKFRKICAACNEGINSVHLQNPLLPEELSARLTKQTARKIEPMIRLQKNPKDATTKTFIVASVLSKHKCLCYLFAAPWTISLGWAGSLKCLCSSVYGVVSTSLRGWMKPSMY